MKSIFSKSHYGLASGVAICLSLLYLSAEAAEKNQTPPTTQNATNTNAPNPLDEYSLKHTVNFNNVSAIEVVRFISKISGYNFIFSQNDLNFNVTIVSEEAMSIKNLLSALIQVLRVNDLKLLEQDDNFLITKADSAANQISTIIQEDGAGPGAVTAPIITKVFRIKNASLSTMMNTLKPMISSSALLEIVPQTNQLIVTDITTNVEKIAALLNILDTPQTNLEIESHVIKNVGSDQIIQLTERILSPFTGSNPLLMIAQKDTNTIFIISTPHLIEQAISVMEDLDHPGQTFIAGETALSTYIYKIAHQLPDVLLTNLKQIQSQIPSGADPSLQEAISSANYISSAGTIVFMTDSNTWNKLQAILSSIDTTPSATGKTTFWVYKTKSINPTQLVSALKNLSSSVQDPSLQSVIANMNWIPETKSLVFSGPESGITRLQEILPTLDVPSDPKPYVYKLLHTSVTQITSALSQIAGNMQDPGFTDAIKNMQFVKGTNSLIFIAAPEATKQLEQILPTLDVATPEIHLFVYKIQKAPEQQVISTLSQIADTTQDTSLAAAIHNMQWMADSHTLIFNASSQTITKLQNLLPTLDVVKGAAPQMYLYKVENTSGDKIRASLTQMASNSPNPALVQSIDNMQWIPESKTLVFHADGDTIAQLKQVLPTLDVASDQQLYIYKIQRAPEDQLANALEQAADNAQDKALAAAVASMQWMQDSHTLVFNASPATIAKLQNLLPLLDVNKNASIKTFMYKAKAAPEGKITATLNQIAKTSQDRGLSEMIQTMQWIPQTQTFVFQGNDESIDALKQILQTVDVSGPQMELYVYKIHKANDAELTSSLEELASASQDKDLAQAVNSMQWIEENRTLIFNAPHETIVKIKNLLSTLDAPNGNMYMYTPKEASKESLSSALSSLADSSKDKELVGAIQSMQWINDGKTCVFYGSQEAISQIEKILPSIDIVSGLQLYVYKVQHAQESQMEEALENTSQILKNKDFSNAVDTMQWMPDSKSLVFHATPSVIAKLKELLPSLDVVNLANKQMYTYQVKEASPDQILSSLEKAAVSLQNKNLAVATENAQWVPDTKTLVFYAPPATIDQLTKILPTIDVTSGTQMYMYPVRTASQEQITTSLQQIASTSNNKDLVNAIDSMEWIAGSKTFIFNGTHKAIAELKGILPTLDVAEPGLQIYVYTVSNVSEKQLSSSLQQAAQNLQNKDLSAAVKTMQWMPDSKTLVFNATPSTIATLQNLLPLLDAVSGKKQMYLYKIQQASEPQIASALEQLAESTQDKELAQAINTMQWIEKSNTLAFNATANAISKLQNLLPSLDVPDTQMFMYKLKVSSYDQMESSFNQMENSLQDPKLAAVIEGRKWIAGSQSFVFHGSSEVLTQLQQILPMIDVKPSSADFQLYVYKIQNISKAQIQAGLEQASDTSESQEFSSAIANMQWIQDSNTLVFNTTPSVIAKLQNLLPTLDVNSLSQMFIYKLQAASQAQMSAALHQLSETVQDPNLAQALSNAQWIEQSKSFVFHASADIIAKLELLVPTLDVSQNVTLYVYKIQNAPEPQIEAALEQTAENLKDKDFTAAVQNMQWMQDSNTLVFHTTPTVIAQLQNLLPTLDVQKSHVHMYIYKAKNPNASELGAVLQQMASTVQNKDLAEAINSMKWIASTKTFIFHGTKEAVEKLELILPNLDLLPPATAPQLYTYTVQRASQSDLMAALEQMSESTQDPDFIAAVEGAKWIPSSNTLVFNAPPAIITKLQNILPTLDVAQSPAAQMYMYKVQIAPQGQIAASLEQMAKTTQDPDLASAINSMRWIAESHAFIFNGTPAAIAQLQSLLPSLDSTTPNAVSAASAKGQFLIYTPKNQTGDTLQATLEELADNLKGSGLQNANLITALESMKWVPSSNSLIFTGDAASLDRIQGILQSLDIATPPVASSGVFLYKPVYASEYQLENALMHFAQSLDPNNPTDQLLARTIYEMQWISSSSSFSFRGDPATLAALKTTLASIDNAQGIAAVNSSANFSLYKLQYASGDTVIQSLITLADKLPPNDINSSAIMKAAQNIRWIKDNNSLMIIGSPYVIDQIKGFISQFDTVSAVPPPATKTEFFIYKPMNLTPEEIQQSLIDLATDLQSTSFTDPDLIKVLQSVRVVPSSKSLMFTGSADALSKVKTIVSTVDISKDASIQTLGTVTFFIYKIKQAPHEDLIRSLQTFAAQLNQSDLPDQTLAKSISSVKWIPETNSLMFTGPQEVLKKVESLVDKFDLGTVLPPQAPRETPATFFVYTPQVQKGSDLINVLHEFMQNLIQSGISDPQLFDTISHLRYIEKTNSLVISGDANSIQKIQELLVKFDVLGKDGDKVQVDSSNFLIYKLQYHQGADIQLALQRVATSLLSTSPEANQGLIDAINSLQWIEVTNSILGTGDAAILAKIKHLITNLDVPLRQVFIEVLVVETSLFNTQNFGLQWGSQFQYLNRTIGAMGNFPTVLNNNLNNSNQPPGTVSLANPLSYATNLNTPVQGNQVNSTTAVPFSTGFDLGVIGDILFHKGQSFISLGSLLNALQVDNDSTVIMNPKIITQDGHTSTIFVGQNIPFVGSFISNSASNTVQSSNIEYRDVGVNLVITPTLGTNNIITLEINQDISEQTPNTTSVQGSQVTGIQTSHTTMNTRVHVPDRHFLVLSGMIQDTKTHFRSSIPCLGGLPVIGALFAENDRANSKSNVIIFIRPFILDSFKDYDLLTADEEALYKTQAGLQDLKEEFDAGPEMIKNLHNE